MEFYTKEGLLLLIQIDHLNGEVLGGLIDRFYESGAKNVQILNSITKKNRPAYVMLIDTVQDYAEKIEAIIVNECGSSGWHRISTSHRHTSVSVLKKQIKIITRQGIYDFEIEGKIISDDLNSIRPEYESCVKLRKLIIDKEQRYIPIKELNTAMMNVFQENKQELEIKGECI